MMRLAISLIPIGRIPGHLSKAIRLQVWRDETALGSTKEVQSRLATLASDWQKEAEADLKTEHNLRHA